MFPDYLLEATLDFKFTTRAFATGIPTVLAGTPVVEIYEDNLVTQITGAETLTVDFDGVVGYNNLRVVATAANGFEAGKSYSAVLSAGTVGGVSVVGEVVAQFSIQRSPALAGQALVTTTIATLASQTSFTLTDGSADDDAYNELIVVIEDAATAQQKAVAAIADYAGSTKTVTLRDDPGIFTMAATDKVRILPLHTVEFAKAYHDRLLTAATHNIATSAGRRLRAVQEFGYAGYIWIDTVNGTAGTTEFENGTAENPVDSIADANTLAASLGINRFRMAPGSSITFVAAQENQVFTGETWTLALGGQSVSGTTIIGATITGNDSGANASATHYRNCEINSSTLGKHLLHNCGMGGTITLAEAADYFWDQCYSRVAGSGTPGVDFESAAEVKALSNRHWSGGMEFKNYNAGGGTHTCTIEGFGQIVLAASCAGGSIFRRGHFPVTDNAGGATTVVADVVALASVCTEARLAELDDTAGKLVAVVDLIKTAVDAIPTTAMRGTDGALTDKTGFALSATGLDAIVAAAVGMIEIAKAVHDRELTGATHNIPTSAGRRLRTLQDFGLYEGGAVWIDTVDGTAGTTDFENGTVNNPVNSIADALTIAASVNLHIFHVLPGSSFTLAASVAGYEFRGFSYSVALNGQSISGTLFENATITGNDSGSNAVRAHFHECAMGSNTLGKHMMRRCGFGGDVILTEATDYFWESCYSQIAGTGTPSVDFESAAETKNLNIRGYSGGMEFKNLGAGSGTHTVSLEGVGQYVLNANCAGGTLKVSGHFDRTDNAGGAVTVVDRVNFETLLDDGTTVYDRTTDSLQEIRDHAETIKTETAAIKAKTDNLPEGIKKNQAFSFDFLVVLASDHVTPAIGLIVTGQRTIDAGAFGAVSGTIAEKSNGIYRFSGLAADLNGDVITYRFSAATADDRFLTIKTTT